MEMPMFGSIYEPFDYLPLTALVDGRYVSLLKAMLLIIFQASAFLTFRSPVTFFPSSSPSDF